jgi:hypothetical protein
MMSLPHRLADRAGRRFDRPDLVALLLGGAGVAYRLVLLLLGVPGTNSDEATFGIAAIHIAEGLERPVYMYGQHYMGVLEAYLAAPLFAAAGPSWLLLRLPLLVLYAVFVWLMYRLTRRLYGPWLAVLTVGLLALGSERVIRDQLTAVGGRPEIKAGVVLLLLIAVAAGQRRLRHGWAGYSAFGLVAGLTAWVDWLVLPYLAAAVAVLAVGAGRRLLGWPAVLALAGFAAGVAPLIIDNLKAPPGEDSVSVFVALSQQGAGTTSGADQVREAIRTGLPLAAGVCPPAGCAPWQAWWGGAYVALLVAAGGLAVVDLRRDSRVGGEPPESGRVRFAAQFALAAAAGLAVLGYVRSPMAALTPQASARYLSILQISTPAVLWPIWRIARRLQPGANALRRVAGGTATTVLVVLSTLMLLATADLVAQVPRIRAEERREAELAGALQHAGVTAAYGTYWTCNRLIFNTRERVACAVVTDDLRYGRTRYPGHALRVWTADRPAFVFAAGEPVAARFADYLQHRRIEATVTEVDGYRIYRPTVTVRPRV